MSVVSFYPRHKKKCTRKWLWLDRYFLGDRYLMYLPMCIWNSRWHRYKIKGINSTCIRCDAWRPFLQNDEMHKSFGVFFWNPLPPSPHLSSLNARGIVSVVGLCVWVLCHEMDNRRAVMKLWMNCIMLMFYYWRLNMFSVLYCRALLQKCNLKRSMCAGIIKTIYLLINAILLFQLYHDI